MTAFGGGFLVAPNPIDFGKVFVEINRLDRNGSIAVLSTIVALLLLYVVVMIIARRADNRDKLKVWTVSNPLYLSTPLIITFRFDYEYETEILRTSVTNLGTEYQKSKNRTRSQTRTCIQV